MAQLDVSEVLTDPDFLDRMTCARQTETVDSNGLAQIATQPCTFRGVVFGEGARIERGLDAETVHSSIRIVTRFRLIDAKAGRTADIVTWRGREYTVTNVNDFTNWGRGFIEAHAELRNFSG